MRIPGLAALASLKQIPHADFGNLPTWIPGLAALASLKPIMCPLIVVPKAMDSGACCPGLIEAVNRVGRLPRIPGIPGLAALASLKHGYNASHPWRLGGFRGLLPWPH